MPHTVPRSSPTWSPHRLPPEVVCEFPPGAVCEFPPGAVCEFPPGAVCEFPPGAVCEFCRPPPVNFRALGL